MRLWRWLGAEPVALGAGEMMIRRALSAATLRWQPHPAYATGKSNFMSRPANQNTV